MLRRRNFYESNYLHFISASTWDFWQAEYFGKRQARACRYAGQGAGAGKVRARRLGRVSGNPKAEKLSNPVTCRSRTHRKELDVCATRGLVIIQEHHPQRSTDAASSNDRLEVKKGGLLLMKSCNHFVTPPAQGQLKASPTARTPLEPCGTFQA